MKAQKFMVLGVTALFIIGCSGGGSNKKVEDLNRNFQLHLLHVNDTHSHLESTRISAKLNGKKTYFYTGGYARIAHYVKSIKRADDHTLFLHAGDAVQGTLYYSLFNGEADIKALNKMDIDAMVLGNHEFDRGFENVTNFIREVKFPIVSANVRFENNSSLIKPYKVFNIDGESVAVIGETVDSSKLSSPGPTVAFLEYLQAAQEKVQELEDKGINKIIFLTHLGYERDKWLAQNVEGIDVIVGGHSHTLLGDFSNIGLKSKGDYPTVVQNGDTKTLIVSAWKWGMCLGDLKIDFDKDGKVVSYSGEPVLLIGDRFLRKNEQGKKVEVDDSVKKELKTFIAQQSNIKIESEDEDVANIVAFYKPKVDEMMSKSVGVALEDLPHSRLPGVVDEDTGAILNHGSLIAPHVALGMYEKAQENHLDVDFSLQNAGGVRHSIPQGEITYGSIKTLLPFGNTLVTLQMQGSDIKEMIEKAVERAYIEQKNTGAFPYLGNARFTIDRNSPKGNRVVEFKIKKDGKWVDLDPNKIYTIATNSYVANGGDYYDEFVEKGMNKYDTGFVDNETFIDYVKKHQKLRSLPVDELPVTVIGLMDTIKRGESEQLSSLNFFLGKAKFRNGFILNTTWGIGSAATHKFGDPENIVYTMTDRGVNIKCKDSADIIGEKICEKGKIFPFPSFHPTIFKWKINNDGTLTMLSAIEFLDDQNRSVTGITNPLSNFDEPAYDIYGNSLTYDPNGLDTEALAIAPDGTFWVGEEYGPSILHLAQDGHILKRFVPKGLEAELSGATYDVEGLLPEILKKRHPNRGIEAIAISNDGSTLYFAMQSPLDNPNYKETNRVRLYKMDIATQTITEYLYELDAPESFIKDNQKKRRKQKDVKLSEMTIDEDGNLIVLERISATTKLYKVNMADATPVPTELSRTLETRDSSELRPLQKELIFTTDDYEGYPSKIEGVANLKDNKFFLINDNDFGIEGDSTIGKIVEIQ